MIRLGVVDFDTSHVVEFTKRLLHKDVAEDQFVDGASIVIGCPGESKMSPERIPGYVEILKKYGVKLVDKPGDMIGQVDGMLISSLEGAAHLERARPFLEKGIPCFVDKPFTCSSDDAKKIVALAKANNTQVFSSSSLRYTPELVQFIANLGSNKVHGVVSYGPCSLYEEDPKRNPGLYHYGIHPLEVLYTLMGPGCKRVTNTQQKGVNLVTGTWEDGRVASVRGIRSGKADYGALVFTDKGVISLPLSTKYIYRELLKQVVSFFQNKKSPLDNAVTIEMMGFIEAANKSGLNHGSVETVPV